MPGRSYTGNGYRYGFNGKEKDDEVSGNGNQYDYGFRIYNPRLGKFLSVDPLTRSYPMLTPYQFASNTPIFAIDLDGLEAAPNSVLRPQFRVWVNPNAPEIPNPSNMPEWEFDRNGHAYPAPIPQWKKALDNSWVPKGSLVKVNDEQVKAIIVKIKEVNHYNEAISRILNGNAQPSDWALINLADRKWLLETSKSFTGYSLPIQDHHIIPQQLETNPVVRKAIKAGYNFQGEQNLMPVFAYRKKPDAGQNANHPEYNEYIGKRLDKWAADNPDASPQMAYDFVLQLNADLRMEIRLNPNEKINEIGKRLKGKK